MSHAKSNPIRYNNTYLSLSICSTYCPPDDMAIHSELFAIQDSLIYNKLILGDFNGHHSLRGSLGVGGGGGQVIKLSNGSELVF